MTSKDLPAVPATGGAGGWTEPELLTTPAEIEARLREVEEQCRSAVDILVKGTSPSETAAPALKRLLARGVRIRCIYETSILESPGGQVYLERWRALGEHQRFVGLVPFRAGVFDRATVLIPRASETGEITSLQVIRAGLGEAIAYLFDLLWEGRTDEPTPAGPATAPEGLAVLTLMCEGMSDKKIAKRLGISERTVQRRLHELATFFGATSRPALAARAVRAGVVNPFGDGSAEEPAP